MTKFEQVVAEIKSDVANGNDKIAPCTFTHFYGRTATSQAFKQAKRNGLIVVNYISAAGAPVYKGG